MKRLALVLLILMVGMLLAACGDEDSSNDNGGDNGDTNGDSASSRETATVVNVIDGDTIDVEINGQEYRVRYIGINTPEREDNCYDEATAANAAMVEGQTVTLERDVSDTDQFDRLLRYVYVDETFVNRELVRTGFAEAVSYPPDTTHHGEFVQLERGASLESVGCHPTGIFNDGAYDR